MVRTFDVFFVIRLDKLLDKQSSCHDARTMLSSVYGVTYVILSVPFPILWTKSSYRFMCVSCSTQSVALKPWICVLISYQASRTYVTVAQLSHSNKTEWHLNPGLSLGFGKNWPSTGIYAPSGNFVTFPLQWRRMCVMTSQIVATRKKHQSYALLALCEGNYPGGWPVDSPDNGLMILKAYSYL